MLGDLNHAWSDNGLKDAIVNHTYHFINSGSHRENKVYTPFKGSVREELKGGIGLRRKIFDEDYSKSYFYLLRL